MVVLLDQAAKVLATLLLAPGEAVAVAPVLNLVLVRNEGAAFSLLREAGGWQRWLLAAVAAAVSLLLLRWLLRLEAGHRAEGLGLALVLGGAVGNLADRLRLGHVVDFLDLHWRGWHWPAFNLADAAITAGVAVLLGCELFRRSSRRGSAAPPP
ncbi:signal peptidase II [Inmirania thermothiophila]|nr:signal peptidase II [Inmirania thermothiophila]